MAHVYAIVPKCVDGAQLYVIKMLCTGMMMHQHTKWARVCCFVVCDWWWCAELPRDELC